MAFEWLRNRADTLLMQPGLCSNVAWAGKTIKGTRTVLKRRDAATLEGTGVSYAFSVLVPASQWQSVPTKPQPLKDRLAVDGASYLVLAVEEDIAHNLRIHLGGEYE